MEPEYPVSFAVDYPDRALNRLTSAFRIFTAIPIVIVISVLSGGYTRWGAPSWEAGFAGPGVLFFPVLLMLVFRQKYPNWWFDWNLQLVRFSSRIGVYVALMDDRYPSTDEPQAVRVQLPYPGAPANVNRWLPLVKWFLAIPHYIVLLFLYLAALVVAV